MKSRVGIVTYVMLAVSVGGCCTARHAPKIMLPAVRSPEACKQWCISLAVTCLNRCQGNEQQCQEMCDTQSAACLKGCPPTATPTEAK